MFHLSRIDLYAVGLGVASSVILGFVIFFKDRKSHTNILFLVFVIASSVWSVVNYLSYQVDRSLINLWLVRFVMFFAVIQAYSFFLLIHTFPRKKIVIGKRMLLLISLFSFFAMSASLTPFVFSGIRVVTGKAPQPIVASGIVIYAAVAVSLVVGGIAILLKRVCCESKGREKTQNVFLLIGVMLMFGLILFFNFFMASVMKNTSFIPMSSVFIFPFVSFTFYAIIKHELLDVKIVGTEIVVFIVSIIALFEVIYSVNTIDVIFRVTIFLSFLIFGIMLIRSVVKEVEQREKLEELTSKLREMDKVKNEFISVAAHELRAPLTAIKGYISMVLDGDVGDISVKAAEFLQDSMLSNERMIRLVNNMLDVSRIEEGRITYQEGLVKVGEILKRAQSEFMLEADQKNLKLVLEMPEKAKDSVYLDGDRLHEVVLNLLSNAIKYTEKGKVVLKLSNPSAGRVRVEVADSGIGISEEEQKKLFHKYYRIKSSAGRTMGTGLGLYVSKLLIEKFGGEIGVSSEPGKGSTFWFELPLTTKKAGAKEEDNNVRKSKG